MKEDYSKKASDKAKKIVAKMKENTGMTAYKLTIIKDSQPDIFDSKFGGVPYWDLSKDYPLDSHGKKMMLLAQINFTKAALEDEKLPKQGMLQFFIASEDDVFGVDFEEADSQKDFRIIYHEQVDLSVSQEQVLALDIPIATSEENEYSPVFKEAAVEITKATAYMGTEDYRFNQEFEKALKEVTGEDLIDQDFYDYLNEDDRSYLYDELCNAGHWLLGYPFFTQGDPREYAEEKYYDTLLFQMDSDMQDKRDYVLWGDCGVANFFINREALEKKDFSKVMYNWDCC